MTTREWRSLIHELRTHFPVQGTVTVVRRPVKCDCGLTTFDGSNYRIRVNSNQEDQGQIDTLLHEWAHTLAIDEAFEHRGRWAELHGIIYDAWCKGFPDEAGQGQA